MLAHAMAALQEFEALFEDEGTSVLPAPGGEEISLFDLKKLYDQRHLLEMEEAMAIELHFYHDNDGDNPEAMAALRRLCELTKTEFEEPSLEFFGSTSFEFFKMLLSRGGRK